MIPGKKTSSISQKTEKSKQNSLLNSYKTEGPVHFDYAVERLAAAWGVKQVTPQITHAVKEALNNLIREQKVVIKGSFLWPPELKANSDSSSNAGHS